MQKTFHFQFLGILILSCIAVYLVISTVLFINKYPVVKAKITDAKYFTSGDRDSADWYIMNLQIISGSRTEHSGKIINNFYFETGLTDPEFKPGQIVELYYDAEDPLDSEIKNFWVQWGPVILVGVISVFYILVMYVLKIVLSRRNIKASKNTIISE